jgi:O-antigen/teichoic acid export membrane protein
MVLKNALIWIGGSFAISQLLRLCFNLILSRLLVPEDFGVMAFALSIYTWFALASDFGLRQSVIAEKLPFSNEFLETYWALQALRSLLLFAACMVGAFFLGIVSSAPNQIVDTTLTDPRTKWYLFGIGICILIDGLRTPFEKSAYRQLARKSIAVIEVSAQVFAGGVMIGAAKLGFGLWSLLLGMLASTIGMLILGFYKFHLKPIRMKLHKGQIRKIVKYARWVWVSSVMQGLINNVDKMIIGTVSAAAIMGLYSIAVTIFSVFAMLLAKIVDEIFNPVLSNIRDKELGQLHANYARCGTLISIGAFVMAAVLFVSAESLIRLLFDKRYVESGLYLTLMAAGLLSARVNMFSALVFTLNLGSVHMAMNFVRLLLTVGLTLFLYSYFSVLGIAFAFGAAPILMLPVVWYFERKVIKSSEPSLWPLFFAGVFLLGFAAKQLFNVAKDL